MHASVPAAILLLSALQPCLEPIFSKEAIMAGGMALLEGQGPISSIDKD